MTGVDFPLPHRATAPAPNVRDAVPEDMPAIVAIYAPYVLTATATFEEVAPDVAEMTRRWRDVSALGLPWLVADGPDGVIGYAYANWFRTRSAYRFTVEDSIYVHRQAAGQGVGRHLLRVLVERCEAAGYRQMVAVIGDSANVASIRLHRSLGFVDAGVLTAVGYKFGRWLDSVYMQRALGTDGPTSAPVA